MSFSFSSSTSFKTQISEASPPTTRSDPCLMRKKVESFKLFNPNSDEKRDLRRQKLFNYSSSSSKCNPSATHPHPEPRTHPTPSPKLTPSKPTPTDQNPIEPTTTIAPNHQIPKTNPSKIQKPLTNQNTIATHPHHRPQPKLHLQTPKYNSQPTKSYTLKSRKIRTRIRIGERDPPTPQKPRSPHPPTIHHGLDLVQQL